MAVTIKDLAKYTDLSISTISLVLNGKASALRISEDTIRRVLDAARELQYKPNILAKSLREGVTRIIGFVGADNGNPFFINITRHLEEEVLKRGYKVVFGGANEDDKACIDTIDTFVNLKVDGLIIVPTEGVVDRIASLKNENMPFVLLDRYFEAIETDCVLLNNYQSALTATEYLITKGRKKIATLRYKTTLPHMEERMAGYKDALSKHKIGYREELTPAIPFSSELSRESIYGIIHRLVETEKIDALFFQTNPAAKAGIYALRDLGCKVPEDISVICFNDNVFYDMLEIKVCSMVQPTEELGINAAHLLLDKISGRYLNTKANKYIHNVKTIKERGMP